MTHLDLFSGIGGFALGFQQAGWKFDKHYFSEINPYAIKIYQRQFPGAIGLGSITGIKTDGFGKVDLITFGFPCQDLSIAGKRAGLAGARSGLFFEATRLIRDIKPTTFIFENVAGLLTSNDGKDFEVVLREIADIGLYECEWQLLNTSWFLPQNRERVYFIGHSSKAGGSTRKVFPIGETCQEPVEQQDLCSCLDANYAKGPSRGWGGAGKTTHPTAQPSQTQQRPNLRTGGVKSCAEHDAGRKQTAEGFNSAKQGFAVAHEGDSINLSQPNSKTRRGRVGGGMANTLDTQMQQFTIKGSRIRRLTEVECERLQGFPDGWTEGVSSSQRYKALGNAVTVDVVAEIAKRLK